MKQRLNSQQGFSIIETVITLFVIMVILVLYQAALNTIFLTRSAKNQETALRVANNKIEELRAAGFAALPASGSFTDTQLASLSSGSAAMAITGFNSNTSQVAVTVQWLEPGSSVLRNISVTTLITKIGGL